MTEIVKTPEITKLVQESGLEMSKAEQHLARFAPHMGKVRELYSLSLDIPTEDPTNADAAKAREIRLALVKVRTSAEKEKDDAKRGLLNETNLIQSLYNVVKNTCHLEETRMEAVEKYQIIKQQQQEAELRAARTSDLQPYQPVDLTGIDLGKMPDATWVNFLAGAKAIHAERERKAQEAADEAARQAELERIKLFNAQRLAERTKRLATVNYVAEISDGIEVMADEDFERFFASAHATYVVQQNRRNLELKRTAELAQYGGAGHDLGSMEESEYAMLLESFRTKHEVIIQRQRAEVLAAEAARKEAERIAQEERAEAARQRLEAELLRAEQLKREELVRQEAERKAKEEKKAAQAPDKQKLMVLLNQLESISLPTMRSEAGKQVLRTYQNKMEDLTIVLKLEIEKL